MMQVFPLTIFPTWDILSIFGFDNFTHMRDFVKPLDKQILVG